MIGVIFTNIFSLFSAYSLTSSAGLLSERSGTVNIALEGKMIIGGLVWAIFMSMTWFTAPMGVAAPFVAMMLSGLTSLIYSLVFSFFTVNLMGDNVIVGTALNLFAAAISLMIVFSITGASVIALPPTGTLSFGWAGDIDTTSIIYLLISFSVLIFLWFFLKKTKWGLRLKTSGENPYSLASAGISVARTRYFSNLGAGFLAGCSGAMAMLTMYGGTFSGTVNGMGYISIAILIFGRWNIIGIGIGTTIISVAMGYARSWGVVGNADVIPQQVIQMIPFVLPLVTMIFIKIFYDKKGNNHSGPPKAIGIPFKKDQR